MIIGYADVDDTHTSFEETTSVLSEKWVQMKSSHFHHPINKKLHPRTTVT